MLEEERDLLCEEYEGSKDIQYRKWLSVRKETVKDIMEMIAEKFDKMGAQDENRY